MEPEITSAPAAPAPAAAPVPAVAAAEPANPDAPKPDRRARRDAIIAKVRDAQAKAAPPTPAATPKAETPVAIPPASAAVAPAPDPRLAALETEAAALRAKLEEAGKAKAAPKDLDGFVDFMEAEGYTMEQISELWLKRQDNPAHKELTAAEKRLKAIEDKIADGEKAQKDREAADARRVAEAEGRKHLRGIIDGDKGRWPRITRSEDNIAEAMTDVTAKASAKWAAHVAAGKPQTDAEASRVIGEALDDLEKDRADRATRYSMPDIPARRTITTTTGNLGTLPTPRPEPAEPLTREQKKAALLARVRAGQPKTT